jgi:CheY-like chemotaxis protein
MPRILVVDDDDNMRRLIKTILARRGHHVVEAGSGAEGLVKFEEEQPDLVITDIVMPGGGGLDLLSELRRRDLPVKALIVSGKRVQLDAELLALARQGAIACIDKPFTPAALAEAVRSLIGYA